MLANGPDVILGWTLFSKNLRVHVDVAVASSQQIELGSVASGTVKPAFGSKFDPNTGAPISKFDPQTGEQNW